MLLPFVNGTLSSLGHDVFVTNTPPKRYVLPMVILFFVLPDGRRTSLSQLRKKIWIGPGITIGSKEHEMIVVVRRGEHDMFNVAPLRQCRSGLVEMGELQIADLNNTRQSHAFLIHIFRICSRTRLA